MRPYLHAGVFVLTLSLAGCEYDSFVLEITPHEDGFQRKLTAWRVKASGDEAAANIAPLPEEQLQRLKTVYGSMQSLEAGAKHVFSSGFSESTPDDLGGYGSLVRLDSPLGSWSIYSERFRGSSDLEAELAKRREAADRLVDLGIGWLRSEIGTDPDFAQIQAFLDQQLRRDAKNLAIHAWTAAAVGDIRQESSLDFLIRSWQYLCERNYFRSRDLPQLTRAASNAQEHPTLLLRLVQRMLARQIGIADDQPIPSSLAWLSDAQRVQDSLDRYLQQSEPYLAHLAEWQSKHADEPGAEPPTPSVVLGDLLWGQLLGLLPLGRLDRLEVRLRCVSKPTQTDGRWDAETNEIRWDHELVSNRALAAFSYAIWSAPQVAFQTSHFGRVLLDGEPLGEYVRWYQGLTADEAEVWNNFLQGCQPGEQLRSRIDEFRFSPDPDRLDDTNASDLAETPRRLLLGALDES